jgi:hypothetical protein
MHRLTDEEVAGYENSFSNNDWRLALTTTEFLFAIGLRHKNNEVFKQLDGKDAIRLSSFSLIDEESHARSNPSSALIRQKHQYFFKTGEEEETEEERYLNNHYNRFMHRTRTMSNPYWLGRHSFKYDYVEKPLFILKCLFAPYPDFFARKLQIRGRMAQSNIDQRWGFQHMMEFEEMREKYERLKSKNRASISNIEDQFAFFNKYMARYGENTQLLCGIYDNLYK